MKLASWAWMSPMCWINFIKVNVLLEHLEHWYGWGMVESVEEIYLPSDSYWQRLVTIHNCFGNVPLKKHQSVLQMSWICKIEHEVCAEGWEDSFVNSWVAKHLDVVHFQNVWSSPGKGHFPVSVGQQNSWVRAIKISLFKAKKKN